MKWARINRRWLRLNDNRRAIIRVNNWGVIYPVEAMYWMKPSLYGRIIKWMDIWSANYYTSMSVVVARSNLLLLRFLLLWFLPLLFPKSRRFLYWSSKTLW